MGGIRGVRGVFWTNMCTYHRKSMYPCQYGQQEEGMGGTSRWVGGLGGGRHSWMA